MDVKTPQLQADTQSQQASLACTLQALQLELCNRQLGALHTLLAKKGGVKGLAVWDGNVEQLKAAVSHDVLLADPQVPVQLSHTPWSCQTLPCLSCSRWNGWSAPSELPPHSC